MKRNFLAYVQRVKEKSHDPVTVDDEGKPTTAAASEEDGYLDRNVAISCSSENMQYRPYS